MTVTERAPHSVSADDVNDPYVIVAADSHAGLPTAQYRQYLEKKYWPHLDDFLAEQAALIEASTKLGVRDSKFASNGSTNSVKNWPAAGTPLVAISP